MELETAWDDADPSEGFEVWPENSDAVGLFLALATQWRVAAGLGGMMHTGLDYTAIGPTMHMLGMPRRQARGLFAQLQVMEAAFLDERSKRRDA